MHETSLQKSSYGADFIPTADNLMLELATWRQLCRDGISYYITLQDNNRSGTPGLRGELHSLGLGEHVYQEAIGTATRYEQVDLQLQQLDFSLVQRLRQKSPATYLTFVGLYKEFVRKLFFTNDYIDTTASPAYPQSNSQKLWLDLSLQHALFRDVPECGDLLRQKMALLETHDFLTPRESAHGAPAPRVSRDRFCLYYVRLRQNFMSAVEARFLATPAAARTESLIRNAHDLVDGAVDVDLSTIDKVFDPSRNLTAQAERDPEDEYDQVRASLKTINSEIEAAASQIDFSGAPIAADPAYERYKKLTAQRDTYTHLLNERKKQLSYLSQAQKFVGENVGQSKAAAVVAGKLVLSTAGVRMGKAVWNSISGKNDKNNWEEIGVDVAFDLGEAAAVGLGTLVFGPIGGKLAGQLVSFMRPQKVPVDPNVKRFKELNDNLDKRFTQLSQQVDRAKAELETYLDGIAQYILKQGTADRATEAFEKTVSALRIQFAAFDTAYSNLTHYSQVTPEAATVLNSVEAIKMNLSALIEQFYSAGTPAVGAKGLDGYPGLGTGSMAFKRIEAYQSDTPANKGFVPAVEDLLVLCEAVQVIIQGLLTRLPALYQSLAAYLLFQVEDDKAKIFRDLSALLRDEETFKAEMVAVGFQLKTLVVGAANLALYENLSGYLNASKGVPLTFLNGFGLAAADGTGQYAMSFNDGQPTGDPVFSTVPAQGHQNRYYILPGVERHAGRDCYRLCTVHTKEIPVPAAVVINLDVNDRVRIARPQGSKDDAISATPVSLRDKAFGGSLERAILMQETFAIGSAQRWNLPLPGFDLVHTSDADHYGFDVVATRTQAAHKSLFQDAKKDGIGRYETLTWVVKPDGGIRLLKQGKNAAQQPVGAEVSVLQPEQAHPLAAGSSLAYYFTSDSLHRLHSLQVYDSGNAMAAGTRVAAPPAGQGGEGLVVMRSLDGTCTMRLERQQIYDAVVNIYKGAERLGSVFSEYRYRNNYDVYLSMQDDGNFVLYDSERFPVAAINGGDKPGSFLHLANDGKLYLIRDNGRDWEPAATLTRSPAIRRVKKSGVPDKAQYKNRLLPAERLRLDEYLVSENGKCYVKMAVTGTYNPGWLWETRYIYSLIAYRDNAPIHIALNENIHNYKEGDSQGIFAVMNADGNLGLVYVKSDMMSKGNYNEYISSGTGGNTGAFLEVTNDGCVNIVSADGKHILKELARV